jgi:hypothetical protein
MSYDLPRATAYVASLDLSGTPRGIVSMDAAADTGVVFDEAKAQAQVVGSGVFAFAQGVANDVREAISDSALLAQLVANKRTSAERDPLQWFAAYSEVLQNVGWTLQAAEWTDYTSEGTAAEVHEKIIEVMAAVLAPAPAALAIIGSTVNALKAMRPDSPWLTLFIRESQKARIARFQVGLVNVGEADDVFVSMLACLIEARSTLTQVLLFKFKSERATFKANATKVSINRRALADLGPTIRTKTRAYQLDYVSSILDV